MKMNTKNYKKPSITQRFFNRKANLVKKEPVQYEMRKKELMEKTQKRKQKLDNDSFLKINREQMLTNVSQIVFNHIEAAEEHIKAPTFAALLFHENNFIRHEWLVKTTSGYSSTMPLFVYVLEDIEYVERRVGEGDVIMFIRKVFDKMQLATECIIITLIYLEKVMITGGIEVRYSNWKPLVFTAILLASKFWEDIKYAFAFTFIASGTRTTTTHSASTHSSPSTEWKASSSRCATTSCSSPRNSTRSTTSHSGNPRDGSVRRRTSRGSKRLNRCSLLPKSGKSIHYRTL